MNLDNFLLELTELTYEQGELLKVFEQAKPYARVKGLKWRSTPSVVRAPEHASCVVIQYGDNMMLDATRDHLSYNLLEHEYVSNIMSRLNFSHPITPHNVDIIWYRPGFRFEPHTDHYASSTMMWPIIPTDGGAPVDFYHRDDIVLEPGKPASYDKIVTDSDIVHTHYYNTTCPTIFNSHQIHGVRPIRKERVYLRLRINETFDSIKEKYANGTLIK